MPQQLEHVGQCGIRDPLWEEVEEGHKSGSRDTGLCLSSVCIWRKIGAVQTGQGASEEVRRM